jgi:hypothetical protein
MKKTFSFLIMVFVGGIMISKAQSEKTVPPPPPPKEPPKVDIKKFQPPVPSDAAKSSKAFMKRNPAVANIWMEEYLTIIKFKSGKKEKYDLKNEAEKKSFVEKYGEPPINPPKIVEVKKFKPLPPPPPKEPAKVKEII